MADETATEIVREFDELYANMGTWLSHWEEAAAVCLPRYSQTINVSPMEQTPGAKKTQEIYDPTAVTGLERFAAAMESMLTPRNQRYQRIVPSDNYILKDRASRLWFEEVTKRLFRLRNAPKANFQSQQHESYMSLGAFGTGAKFIDGRPEGGFRYSTIPTGQVLFNVNYQGIIDCAYRKMVLTARQMKQRLDEGLYDRIPDAAMKALEKEPNKQFALIHWGKPRRVVKPYRMDFQRMEYASYYVAVDEKTVLSEGGYNKFPYAISRYVTGPGEIYGRGPAMMALSAIKVLNQEKKDMLKQGQRVVDPVLLMHDDGVLDTFSLKPGAQNIGGVNKDGRPLVHTLPTGNLAAGFEMMELERRAINDAFLVTLFQILIETPTMTATEVLERAREKGALLSPTMGRQQSEDLGVMTEREIDLMEMQGQLPPFTPAMIEAQGEWEIEYDSPLSRAQRAEEAAGFLRTFEVATAYANSTQDFSALDYFNKDVIFPQLASINAVPESWMNDPKQVQAIRDQRAQAQMAQGAIEAAPGAAGISKALN